MKFKVIMGTAVVIGIVILVVVFVYFNTNNTSNNSVNESAKQNEWTDITASENAPTDSESDANGGVSTDKNPDANDNQEALEVHLPDISDKISFTFAAYERGGIAAGAIIEGVANDNVATCTITVTSNTGATISNSANAVDDSRTISCVEGMFIPQNQLHSGNWEVEISYKSESVQGSKKFTSTIQVP